METSATEKEWLRRISGGKPTATIEKQTPKKTESKQISHTKFNNKGRGFADIAGMDSLKQIVKEGDLWVILRGRICQNP